jgi:hypothetical protein
MVIREPITTTVFKTALEMQMFSAIGSQRRTCKEISDAIGADPLLVKRIARLLAASSIIDEVDIDTYANTDFSQSMIEPDGLCNGFQYFYDIGLPQMTKLPSYMKSTGYKNPDDYNHPPFEYNMHPDKGYGSFWHWLAAHPAANKTFDNFMSALHPPGRPPWMIGIIIKHILSDFDPSRPLVVDVGGGNGKDQVRVLPVLPDQCHAANIIVQDRPEVIEEAMKSPPPEQIRLLSHNFFDPQPEEAKGAKAYYLSTVLHNWPDKQAIQILVNIRDAMKPGYSRLYIHESVIAERDSDVRPGLAAMDINMMSHFAALERTKKQWEELLEQAELKLVDYHERYPGAGVLEADLI